MNKDLHFSSKTNEWATPQDFFDILNKEFKFNLDPCATKENAKCKKFYTEQDDGLRQTWNKFRVFCNPPYGREIGKWVKKGSEAMGGGSCDASSSTDRYSIFSSIYLQEKGSRNSLSQRSAQVWWEQNFCTIPLNGCYI